MLTIDVVTMMSCDLTSYVAERQLKALLAVAAGQLCQQTSNDKYCATHQPKAFEATFVEDLGCATTL